MATASQLSQPQRFIQSALANVDLAHWFVWQHGICVGYWDESERTHSVCCWWTALDQAFLFQTESIVDVCVEGHQVIILSGEGFFTWDGQQRFEHTDTPCATWKKVTLTSWGAIGFTKFGYHTWHKSTNEVSRLPMGVQRIWGGGSDGSVLWSHWGQFFVLNHGRISALEPVDDTMDSWVSLRDGWWVAVYEHKLLAFHVSHTAVRFDNMEIMDVACGYDSQSIKILLASGMVLEWRPSEDPEPIEIGEANGEFFIGEGALYDEGEIEFLFT